MQTTTIRPGLLVALNTSVSGNVQYRKLDLETDHTTEEGARKARWETERTINDPAEFEEATQIRGKARGLIASVCAASAFGLLCPQDRAEQLAAAITEAQRMAEEFNRRATLTRVKVYVVAGTIAQDDLQATKAINAEIAELLNRMESGVRSFDVEAIRDAAKRAKSIAAMVTPEASERLEKAIDTARTAARQIVKAGETAAKELDERAIRAITESRTAFLDLDDAAEIATPTVTGRALDFDPAPEPVSTAPRYEARALELF
jgi:hypothetical protein